MKTYIHEGQQRRSTMTVRISHWRHRTGNPLAEGKYTSDITVGELGPNYFYDDRGTGHRGNQCFRDLVAEVVEGLDAKQHPIGPIGKRGGHVGKLVVRVDYHFGPLAGQAREYYVDAPGQFRYAGAR